MRGHIIVAFEGVNEARVTINDEVLHINLKVPLHIRVGIFANNKRSTGMVAEHLAKPDIDVAGLNNAVYLLAYFYGSSARGGNNKGLLDDHD